MKVLDALGQPCSAPWPISMDFGNLSTDAEADDIRRQLGVGEVGRVGECVFTFVLLTLFY